MIHSEKLKAIEDRIRKDLPYLINTSIGCMYKNKHNNRVYIIIGVQHSKIHRVFYHIHTISFPTLSKQFVDRKSLYENYDKIGHQIKLNDVLKWIDLLEYRHHNYEEKDILNNLNVKQKYPFFTYNGFNSLWYVNNQGLLDEWNLERSLLKDQSQKFINFLYELL